MEASGHLHAPAALPPGKEPPVPTGDWVGPWAGLDAVDKRKILPCRESHPGSPARSPSLYRLSYFGDSIAYIMWQPLYPVLEEMIGLCHCSISHFLHKVPLFKNIFVVNQTIFFTTEAHFFRQFNLKFFSEEVTYKQYSYHRTYSCAKGIQNNNSDISAVFTYLQDFSRVPLTVRIPPVDKHCYLMYVYASMCLSPLINSEAIGEFSHVYLWVYLLYFEPIGRFQLNRFLVRKRYVHGYFVHFLFCSVKCRNVLETIICT
jgi:hypothetical protein